MTRGVHAKERMVDGLDARVDVRSAVDVYISIMYLHIYIYIYIYIYREREREYIYIYICILFINTWQGGRHSTKCYTELGRQWD